MATLIKSAGLSITSAELETASLIRSGEEKREATLSYFEKQIKKTLPEVEELEIHFYEDGIESVAMSLRMRHIEAMEHWKGNKNFSQFDIMTTLLENFEEEEF
jgi:2-iminoacetate synthase ThiH